MRINFLRSSEKKKLIKELNNLYGLEKLPYTLLETGKGKIRGFSGNLMKEQLNQLAGIARVEIVGMYLMRREKSGELRFSLDGSMIFDFNKGVVEISENDLDCWMNGGDLNKKFEYGMKIIKYKEDFLGSGKSNGEKLINFVPKERRIRKSYS